MNKIYKLIWSKAKNCWVVASELAKGHGKNKSRVKNSLLAAFVMSALLAGGVADVQALTQQEKDEIKNEVALDLLDKIAHGGEIPGAKAEYGPTNFPDAIANRIFYYNDVSSKIGEKLKKDGLTLRYFGVRPDYIEPSRDYLDRYADSTWTNVDNDGAFGAHSMALGYRAFSEAKHGVAIGREALAGGYHRDNSYGGDGDVAIGNMAWALGDKAVSIGDKAISADKSIAIGIQAEAGANKNDPKSIQRDPETNLPYVVSDIAKMNSAIAIGRDTKAWGHQSVSIGGSAKATGKYALSFGNSAEASAMDSFAFGNYASAKGIGAIAIGSNYDQSSDAAKAYSGDTIAIGRGSIAGDENDTTTAYNTVAIGVNAKAKPDYTSKKVKDAVLLGANTTVKQERGTAVGANAYVDGASGAAFGDNASVVADEGLAIGKNAKIAYNSTKSIAIGSGAEVKNENANPSERAVAVGTGAVVGGKSSDAIAIGTGAKTQEGAQRSIAIGKGAVVKSYDSVVIGTNASAQWYNSVAIGNGAQATLSDGIALGSDSKTTVSSGYKGYDPYKNAFVIDANPGAAWESTKAALSVGDVGNNITRQITSVAAGRNDTDAVNVAQLKKLRDYTDTKMNIDLGNITPKGIDKVKDWAQEAIAVKSKKNDYLGIEVANSASSPNKMTYYLSPTQKFFQKMDTIDELDRKTRELEEGWDLKLTTETEASAVQTLDVVEFGAASADSGLTVTRETTDAETEDLWGATKPIKKYTIKFGIDSGKLVENINSADPAVTNISAKFSVTDGANTKAVNLGRGQNNNVTFQGKDGETVVTVGGANDAPTVTVGLAEAFKQKIDNGAIHYFSVNSHDSANPDGTNWNNDGAKGRDAVAIGSSAKAEREFTTAVGAKTVAAGRGANAYGGGIAAGAGTVAIGQNAVAALKSGITQEEYDALSSFKKRLYISDNNGLYYQYRYQRGKITPDEQNYNVAIGSEAESYANQTVSLGYKAKSDVDDGVALGAESSANRQAGGIGYIATGSSATFEDALTTLNKKEDYDKWTAIVDASKKEYDNLTKKFDIATTKENKAEAKAALDAWKEQHADFVEALASKEKLEATWKGTKGAVSVGKDEINEAGNRVIASRQITNVAAGTEDTDAVNVAQLKTAKTTVKAGDYVTVSEGTNADGGKEYTVNGPKLAAKTGDTNIIVEDDVEEATKKKVGYKLSLSKTLTGLESITSDTFKSGDNVTINKEGLTITGGPSVTKDGINAGNKQITGVADGDVSATSTDAVNGKQLNEVKTKVETNEENITELQKGWTLADADANKKIVKADNTVTVTGDDYINATVSDAGLTLGMNVNKLNTQINNQIDNSETVTNKMNSWVLKATSDTDEEKNGKTINNTDNAVTFDATGDGLTITRNGSTITYGIDGKQIDISENKTVADLKTDIKNSKATVEAGDYVTVTQKTEDGKGTTYTVNGPKLAAKTGDTNIVVEDDVEETTKKKVGYKLSLNKTLTGFESITSDTFKSGDNVTINKEGLTITDGPSVTTTGIDAGNKKITNVAAGTEKTDAVNVEQLDNVENKVNTNTTNIAANKAAIEKNAGDIAANKAAIEKNAGDIAANKTAIEKNAGDIAANKTAIEKNAGDIAANKTAIEKNAGDIAANKTAIEKNTKDIAAKMTSWKLKAEDIAGEEEIKDGNEVTFGVVEKDKGLTVTREGGTIKYGIEGDKIDISKNESITGLKKEIEESKVTLEGDDTTGIVVTPEKKDGKPTNYKISLGDKAKVGDVTIDGTKGKGSISGLSEVKVGDDVKLDKEGLTINGGPSMTKGGINAGDKKITNVKDGDISENSKDAVNGGQLYKVDNKVNINSQNISILGNKMGELGNRVNRVGAGAAALAALHPLDFDPDDKWDFAAGYGNYKGANAAAIGAYYRPNEDTMVSVGGSFGGGENMVNAGVSVKLGQGNHVTTSRVAMAKEIKDLRAEVEVLRQAVTGIGQGQTPDPVKMKLFPDIAKNHWAYEAVEELTKQGLLEGYPDGTFGGDRMMTRYEFAEIVYRAMQKGLNVNEKLIQEFEPELERFRIDVISKDKNGNPVIERVRVNEKKKAK